jgi:hypothetical protein
MKLAEVSVGVPVIPGVVGTLEMVDDEAQKELSSRVLTIKVCRTTLRTPAS